MYMFSLLHARIKAIDDQRHPIRSRTMTLYSSTSTLAWVSIHLKMALLHERGQTQVRGKKIQLRSPLIGYYNIIRVNFLMPFLPSPKTKQLRRKRLLNVFSACVAS